MKHRTVPALFVLAALVPSLSFADGVSINPGQWEMTSEMRMSMLPQPQTRTFVECVEETEINPEEFNMDENIPCTTSDVRVEGNTIRWKMLCPSSAGSAEGSWEFTSSGDSIKGKGSMSMSAAGQTMEISMNWTGERLGDCVE